jgi:hypothetical protein
MKTTQLLSLVFLTFAASALAVDPPPDGGYPNRNAAEGGDALFSNTTGSDNAQASWIWRGTGNLNTPRYDQAATLLLNGMVLVAGGADSSNTASTSAELYDPASGTWTATSSLNTARFLHTATLLPNGMVLVAGGSNSYLIQASAELYDPANGFWAATTSLKFSRHLHTATLLGNGRVLVAGGSTGSSTAVKRAELGGSQP